MEVIKNFPNLLLGRISKYLNEKELISEQQFVYFLQIARLSVVGIDGRPVYDSLIQPENPIIDYNTRFSGLTERDFKRGESNKSSNNSNSSNAIGPPVKVNLIFHRK